MKRLVQSFFLSGLVAFSFLQEGRAGGVTIITHGFNSNVTDWIIPMAGKIGGYPGFPGASYSCYEISITRDGSGQYLASASLISGLQPSQTDSGEIVVKLDWSTLSSFGGASSTTIAQAATNAVLSPTLIPELGGHSLAESPLHLIGHSRGGSVVTEMARLLGAQGVWVDHVSTLDPRPVAQLGDAAVTSWANVLYADNFWQNMGDGVIVPNGQSVFGACNRKLLDLNGGYSSSHSDVHLWYQGTIDLATPSTDTQATITATQRGTWWTTLETQGATAGFLYSLIGRGDRLSNLEPAGAGNGRISDGFNRKWDLGGGLAANRTALSVDNGLWPNPLRLLLNNSNGASFTATLYYQAGPTSAGQITADLLLDADANPYDGNEIAVGQTTLPRTGTAAVLAQSLSGNISASVPAGTYNLLLRLTDNGFRRYLYCPQKLIVPPPIQSPWIDGDSLQLTGGVMHFDIHGIVGQTIRVDATTDLATWLPLETHLLTGPVLGFTDAKAANFSRRLYRVVRVSQ